MPTDRSSTFTTLISSEPMPDPGLFTWELASDTLYADSVLATLFGLDVDKAEHGLPLSSYMARVHPADAPGLAKQITDAIIAKHPTEQRYRVMNFEGKYITVRAYGRCFHDQWDQPAHYAGIVIPDESGGEPGYFPYN